jgi:hypothetical protein
MFCTRQRPGEFYSLCRCHASNGVGSILLSRCRCRPESREQVNHAGFPLEQRVYEKVYVQSTGPPQNRSFCLGHLADAMQCRRDGLGWAHTGCGLAAEIAGGSEIATALNVNALCSRSTVHST